MSNENPTRVVKLSLPRDLLEKAAAELGVKNLNRLPSEINLVAVPESPHLQAKIGHVHDMVIVR